MKRPYKRSLLFVPLIALSVSGPASAEVQQFAATKAVAIASDTGSNSLEYLVSFTLPGTSNGMDPANEVTLLSAEPSPTNAFADQIPRFQISVPPGCWVDLRGSGVSYQINGLGCGVEVRLFDPVTATTVSVNSNVTDFTAQVINPDVVSRPRGFFKVIMKFDSGFDPVANINPAGLLSFSIGDDGVTGASLNGRTVTRNY